MDLRLRSAVIAFASTVAASAVTSVAGCDMGAAPAPDRDAPITAAHPFTPESPYVYVAKVKNILVGLPPTEAEMQAVVTQPSALAGLIDRWMGLREYDTKMLRFFELAFQQTQIAMTDLAAQVTPRQVDVNASTSPLLLQNVQESFARTMIELLEEGHPLTDATTTSSYMMTPALMELYAFLDAEQIDDASVVSDTFEATYPDANITIEAAQGPIPMDETLDPASPNFMHWYDPDVATDMLPNPGCAVDPLVYKPRAITIHYLLYGALDGRQTPEHVGCGVYSGSSRAPQVAAADFSTWKMVTIRPPNAGEQPTTFYDLPTLRSTTTLVLRTPRLGFFTTPAFFANWPTNASNQMRVTTNQALIVATGAMVDGNDTTPILSTPGLDAAHASQVVATSDGKTCRDCHKILDPTRSILAASFSWPYHQQTDPSFTSQPGLFQFEGLVTPVSSVSEFGAALANHPLFAQAWAQKLCYYANSAPCDPTDAEFQRVVGVFVSSGYSWNALVRELLSSPIVTYTQVTQSAGVSGEIAAVERRDHLCAALNARFGFDDICGLDAATKQIVKTPIPAIVSGLPSDGYGRGATAPVLPNLPTLFFRAGTENICEAVSALVVDATAQPNVTTWSSSSPEIAIADFVSLVMGLTASDSRASSAQAILQAHYASAIATGASPTDSLRSTFVAACLAPSAISIGL